MGFIKRKPVNSAEKRHHKLAKIDARRRQRLLRKAERDAAKKGVPFVRLPHAS